MPERSQPQSDPKPDERDYAKFVRYHSGRHTVVVTTTRGPVIASHPPQAVITANVGSSGMNLAGAEAAARSILQAFLEEAQGDPCPCPACEARLARFETAIAALAGARQNPGSAR